MNPTVLSAVRERMRSQTSEQLLELWVTNDRATWSAETFEAIKSVLAERGKTDLPPQNGPAPLARPHKPIDIPEHVYWMGWLRPVLWIGIIVSCLTLFCQAVAAWEWSDSYWLDEPWDLFLGTMHYLLLPPLLITGSVACLRFVPWSRAALLTYGWLAISVYFSEFVSESRRIAWDDSWVFEVAAQAVTSAHQLVLPLVLLFLLRRPEIRALFTHARPGAGFEPAVLGGTPTAARHP
jgi:hypothetical protein